MDCFHCEKGIWSLSVVVVGGEGHRPAGVLEWAMYLNSLSQSDA
jgi:hypothetical protein